MNNMIMRDIITTDANEWGWTTIKLSCGHEVGPISRNRVPKKRKRCPFCEQIAAHRTQCPDDHESLMRYLHRVPMDDRAATMVQWINHLSHAKTLRLRGIEGRTALMLTEMPSTYPLLRFMDESDENDVPLYW